MAESALPGPSAGPNLGLKAFHVLLQVKGLTFVTATVALVT